MTYRELLNEGKKRLAAAGTEEAEVSARELLLFTCGLDFAGLLKLYEEEVPESSEGDGTACGTVPEYLGYIARRAAHEPLQYITRTQDFCGLDLYVDGRVLIPRQDTEVLVAAVLEDEKRLSRAAGGTGKETAGTCSAGSGSMETGFGGRTLLDVCTGSGCIGLTLAKLGDFREVTLSDISGDALEVAEMNLQRTAAGERTRVRVLRSDLFDGIPAGERFDVITANPPYIASEVIGTLSPEVRDFEPRKALDGTADGLFFYRRLAKECPGRLSENGRVYFEIGYDQRESVAGLLEDAGFTDVRCVKDLAGLDRVVTGRIGYV